MNKKKSKCDSDCDGQLDFPDRIFNYCLCEARNMNAFIGARVVTIKYKEIGNENNN